MIFQPHNHTCTVLALHMASVASPSNAVEIGSAGRESGVHVSHLALHQLEGGRGGRGRERERERDEGRQTKGEREGERQRKRERKRERERKGGKGAREREREEGRHIPSTNSYSKDRDSKLT